MSFGNRSMRWRIYRRSMALDQTRALYLQRKVIDLQLTTGGYGPG